MSQLHIRDTLISLVQAVGYPVAYENSDFSPEGHQAWLAVHFMPTTSESLSTSADDERGVFQVSVFTKRNSGNFDTEQLRIIDELKRVFYTGANSDGVTILDVSTNAGQPSNGWYQRDLSIEYSSYINRG